MARKDPEHVQEIIDSEFNRRPADTETYRANCTTGYIFTFKGGASGQSHFHHVLPIQTLGSGYLSPKNKIDFFHQCMAMTKWDINEGHNLIGLPTRKVYHAYEQNQAKKILSGLSGGKTTPALVAQRALLAQQGVFGAIPDLPCHQNNHDVYNTRVITYLKRQVWQPLVKEQPKCKLEPVDIRTRLCKASDHWRDFLTDRGEEHGGANHCWVHRNDRGYKKFWYVPFSMHPGKPPASPPPPSYADLERGEKGKWVKSLFSR